MNKYELPGGLSTSSQGADVVCATTAGAESTSAESTPGGIERMVRQAALLLGVLGVSAGCAAVECYEGEKSTKVLVSPGLVSVTECQGGEYVTTEKSCTTDCPSTDGSSSSSSSGTGSSSSSSSSGSPTPNVGINSGGSSVTEDRVYDVSNPAGSLMDMAKEAYNGGYSGNYNLPVSAYGGAGHEFGIANRDGGGNGWCDGSILIQSPEYYVDLSLLTGVDSNGNNAYSGFGLESPVRIDLNNPPPCHVVFTAGGDVNVSYVAMPYSLGGENEEVVGTVVSTDGFVNWEAKE